jgi:diaminopimelate decarboxylase
VQVDLKMALDSDIYINVDNEQEALVVDQLLSSECSSSNSKIGLRINPVVGGGVIALFSIATASSKFGLPVMDSTRDRIVDLYKTYSWLTGVHIHVGSQGQPLNTFIKGARVRFNLYELPVLTCS